MSDRLKELEMFSLEKIRLKENSVSVSQKLFSTGTETRTRNIGYKVLNYLDFA